MRLQVTTSSGNVFADLGFPDAEERLLKASLAIQIERILRQRKLTPTTSAKLLGVDQSTVLQIRHGRLADFSTDRLLGFVRALGRDVDIVIHARPQRRGRGRLRVIA